ncbi:ergothioneine biosynthesis protein EgtB [Novispirillum sp. DQ9]|uniref:ergothioneine biosynthesis protein EgtB n=1 Tax=Novispirillum sp. DQ9 TaxID=3398612 RepID=UPI003C79C611
MTAVTGSRPSPPEAGARADALRRWRHVRRRSEELAAPLTPEDQGIQSMPDASPTKWHLGHTTWFFETLLLVPHAPGYRPFDTRFPLLFNSYYEALGPRHPRPQRGVLSRPAAAEVAAWRQRVDGAVADLIATADAATWAAVAPLLDLGLAHEEQHQELLLTDIKHALSLNPLAPAYDPALPVPEGTAPPLEWIIHPGGLVDIGHAAGAGFAYDNEEPRHRCWLEPFRLASRAVTCGEFLAFIDDGGYARPEFWHADGWDAGRLHGWGAPLYWHRQPGGGWTTFTLAGPRPVAEAEPVTHLSFYEAAAYAAWAGARLPTEAEWEAVAAGCPVAGTFATPGAPLHPAPAAGGRPAQMFGDVWEWTSSAYAPYPGFRPFAGVAAEYNGKFMVNQMVLRGGSCATPAGHVRASYRNFFPPSARWQFSGVRLAEDV